MNTVGETVPVSHTRLVEKPGFQDWPDGFDISEYHVGEDHWSDGFVVMVNIFVPSTAHEGRYHVGATKWRPGDLYEIAGFDESLDPLDLAFNVGDVVRCEEGEYEGHAGALFAVERAP